MTQRSFRCSFRDFRLGYPDVEEGQSLISERTVESFQGGHE
jgi:hypothetical protein